MECEMPHEQCAGVSMSLEGKEAPSPTASTGTSTLLSQAAPSTLFLQHLGPSHETLLLL